VPLEDVPYPGMPRWIDEPAPFRLCFARLVTHYFANGSWMEEGQVLRDAGRLASIPGVLVEGTMDLNNLVGAPWLLERAWPGVELRMVEAGHETRSEAMVDALIEATDRFAVRP